MQPSPHLCCPGCSWLILWLLLAAHGCAWLLMAGLLLAVHGCSWLGCSWLLLAAPGCSWLCLASKMTSKITLEVVFKKNQVWSFELVSFSNISSPEKQVPNNLQLHTLGNTFSLMHAEISIHLGLWPSLNFSNPCIRY